MKKLNIRTAYLVLLITSISFYSCTLMTDQKENEDVDEAGIEYTSSYVCPMHCDGSGAEEPGTCPVCEMDYVRKGTSATEEEDLDQEEVDSMEVRSKEYTATYICPMYCEGSGSDEAGVCPVCAMDYVLNENPLEESEEEEIHEHEH